MRYLMIISLAAIVVAGCASGVQRVDPNTADEINTGWDIKDVNIIAETMIKSLETHRLAYKNPPAVIVVLNVKNKTMDDTIDTKAITETVITALLKTGKYKAIAEPERRADMAKEEDYKKATTGQGSGLEDGELVPMDDIQQYKTKVGAELVMYGEISGIEKYKSGKRDVSYKMTLKLVDIDAGTIEWQDQKDIRKQQTRGTFGW